MTRELSTYQHANLLVGILAGHAVGRELHQDGLGGHWETMLGWEPLGGRERRTEWKLLVDTRANDTGVDNKAVGNVVQGQEDRVGEEELHAVRVSATQFMRGGHTISGISMRRMALSSRLLSLELATAAVHFAVSATYVLSNHCVSKVAVKLAGRRASLRPRAVMRSERMGFLCSGGQDRNKYPIIHPRSYLVSHGGASL